MTQPTLERESLRRADTVVREMACEKWRGMQVAAYIWERPTGFEAPSSATYPSVAFHWSSGPDHAERLYRESDVRALISSQEAEIARLREAEGAASKDRAAWSSLVHRKEAVITTQEQRLKVAVEALEPFGRAAEFLEKVSASDSFVKGMPDTFALSCGPHTSGKGWAFTLVAGAFRKARAALVEARGEGE